jgi:Rrf2 family protein
MAENTRFPVAVHLLGWLAETDEAWVRSEALAWSIDTNAVVVRRLVSNLAAAGLVETRRGTDGGVRLSRPAETISLAEIRSAVEDREGLRLHRPNPACEFGVALGVALAGHLRRCEAVMVGELAKIRLSDVIPAKTKPVVADAPDVAATRADD